MRTGQRAWVVGILGCALLTSILAIAPPAATARETTVAPEAGGATDWRVVSAGLAHTCAIRAPGRLYCWGSDQFGQLGDGPTNTGTNAPVEVAGGFSDWTSVSAGTYHSCGLRRNGRLYCWGYDLAGELGNGGPNQQANVPVEVAGSATNWTSVAAGGIFTCGRRRTGRLFCWGQDDGGTLGNGGADQDATTPKLVAGGIADWRSVVTGESFACGLRSTGRLYCWGYDSEGQVGNGPPFATRTAPTQVAGGVTTWTTVAAGSDHACARRSSGRLFCWGSDGDGRLGDGGTNTSQPAPRQVAGGRTDWAGVAGGSGHTCARRTSGRLFCWGFDGGGQLGNGPGVTASQSAPDEVSPPADDWAAVEAGGAVSCARTEGGRLYCWGYDFLGQVGDGPPTPNSVDRPTEVYVPA